MSGLWAREWASGWVGVPAVREHASDGLRRRRTRGEAQLRLEQKMGPQRDGEKHAEVRHGDTPQHDGGHAVVHPALQGPVPLHSSERAVITLH